MTINLEKNKFYTIKNLKKNKGLIVWNREDKNLEKECGFEISESTIDEKEYWQNCMDLIDDMKKNDFVAVGIDFKKFNNREEINKLSFMG